MFRSWAYRLKVSSLGKIRVRQDKKLLLSQKANSKFAMQFTIGKAVPVYSDFFDAAGVSSGHYFHQDLFFAKEIYAAAPNEHFDLGSRIDGFIAHLASFRQVNVFDIRLMSSKVPGINFTQLDVMDNLSVSTFPKVNSLSCLHTAEHFGLGRYGDNVDFDGWEKGIRNLASLLNPGGRFYFSVPIAREQRIEFNAHRVFNPRFMTNFLSKDFEVVRTAAVRDDGSLDLAADFLSEAFIDSFRDSYACGLWVLEKK